MMSLKGSDTKVEGCLVHQAGTRYLLCIFPHMFHLRACFSWMLNGPMGLQFGMLNL